MFNQKGLTPLIIVVIIVVFFLSVGAYYKLVLKKPATETPNIPLASETPTADPSSTTTSKNPLSTNSPTPKTTATTTPSSSPTSSPNNSSSSNQTSSATSTPTNTPTPTISPTPVPKTVNTSNGITTEVSCPNSSILASVYGDIPSPNDRNNGLWSTLTDGNTGQIMIYEFDGNQGPPTIHISANFPATGAIRGSSISVVGDGRTYTVKVYSAPFTDGTPSLSNLVAQNSFSKACN